MNSLHYTNFERKGREEVNDGENQVHEMGGVGGAGDGVVWGVVWVCGFIITDKERVNN